MYYSMKNSIDNYLREEVERYGFSLTEVSYGRGKYPAITKELSGIDIGVDLPHVTDLKVGNDASTYQRIIAAADAFDVDFFEKELEKVFNPSYAKIISKQFGEALNRLADKLAQESPFVHLERNENMLSLDTSIREWIGQAAPHDVEFDAYSKWDVTFRDMMGLSESSLREAVRSKLSVKGGTLDRAVDIVRTATDIRAKRDLEPYQYRAVQEAQQTKNNLSVLLNKNGLEFCDFDKSIQTNYGSSLYKPLGIMTQKETLVSDCIITSLFNAHNFDPEMHADRLITAAQVELNEQYHGHLVLDQKSIDRYHNHAYEMKEKLTNLAADIEKDYPIEPQAKDIHADIKEHHKEATAPKQKKTRTRTRSDI